MRSKWRIRLRAWKIQRAIKKRKRRDPELIEFWDKMRRERENEGW